MPYDRFTLEGGLDTLTPYLSRTSGTLLQALNYEPDTDGGYRMMLGFERYDGHPAPSDSVVTVIETDGDFSGAALGDSVSFSGGSGILGKVVDGHLLWVDITSGDISSATSVTVGSDTAAVLYSYSASLDATMTSPEFTGVQIVVGVPTSSDRIAVGDTVRNGTGVISGIVRYVMDDGINVWLYISGTVVLFDVADEVTDGTAAYTVSSSTFIEDLANNPNDIPGLGYYFATKRRDLIGPVPGQGPVRGVWDLKGVRYAFRDFSDDEGRMYQSSTTGWQQVSLGITLRTIGRPSDVTDLDLIAGDSIRGGTSGATAIVGSVGYIDANHSQMYIVITSSTGTFVSGEQIINDTQDDKVMGTLGSAPTLNTLPAGGEYRFENHNFFARPSALAMYGVNGVGNGFVFDGEVFSFIFTGSSVDTPFDIKVHYDHLFYAFPGGSLQHSVVGSPMDWSGGLGALEIGLGAEITNLIKTPKALIVSTEIDVQSVTGSGLDDWAKNVITEHTGVAKFTGAYQSQTLMLSPAGLLSIDRVDAYGDFADAVISDKVRELIRRLYSSATIGFADKTKSQYRIHFSNGLNLLFAFKYSETGGTVGIMPFQYGDKIVRTSANPSGRIFFTSDDGYVYEAEKGLSDDGHSRVRYIRTSFANQEDPDSRKRFVRATISVREAEFVQANVGFTFSKGKALAPSSFISGIIFGRGGLWDLDNWNEVFWDGADTPEIRSDIDGVGSDISTMIYSDSRILPVHVVEDITLEYKPRRKTR